MMFFGDGQFPRCANYLRTRIIGMSKSSKVYKALIECIENETLVEQAISAGTYPCLKIENLVKGYVAPEGIYQGECDASKLNYVYVHTRVADGFEHFTRRVPPRFESVLLHEVVHWGRFIGGKPGTIHGKEAGSWFEKLAYDKPYMGHNDLVCPA
jgi:hypothetical protein